MTAQEKFAAGFHEWALYIGFPGFSEADYKRKMEMFRLFLKNIPKRPEGNQDPFFNVGMAKRQDEWDKKYEIYKDVKV